MATSFILHGLSKAATATQQYSFLKIPYPRLLSRALRHGLARRSTRSDVHIMETTMVVEPSVVLIVLDFEPHWVPVGSIYGTQVV
jgi:hypothetical protein